MPRRAVTPLATGLLALAQLVPATHAAAVASPEMTVVVNVVSGGFRACAWGSSADFRAIFPHWEFHVDGTIIPTSMQIARDGRWFFSKDTPACVTVAKFPGTISGSFTAYLVLVSDSDDLANSVFGAGAWAPGVSDQTTSQSTCGFSCINTSTTP